MDLSWKQPAPPPAPLSPVSFPPWALGLLGKERLGLGWERAMVGAQSAGEKEIAALCTSPGLLPGLEVGWRPAAEGAGC